GSPEAASGPVVEWEEPNCLLCNGRRWSPLIEAPDGTAGGTGYWFAVVQCQECGLCFTSPRPSSNTISQFYPARYSPHRPPNLQRPARWWHALVGRYTPWRERALLDWHGQGRLLDFGCGGGAFLERMHRHGWRVTGLDISAAAVHRVRTEL